MLRNYLVVAFRNLVRHKGYSAINISGLAFGIACCLLTFLYVRDEVTYDRFHRNGDAIYRATSSFKTPRSGPDLAGLTPPPLARALKTEFPEVKEGVRFWNWQSVVRRGDRLTVENVHFVDPAFLKVFSFPLLRGAPATALQDPNAVVLSEDVAQRYFGQEDPIGRVLSFRVGKTFQDLTVMGVAQRIPENSSIRFDILVPFEKIALAEGQQYATSWFNFSVATFVQLSDPRAARNLESKLPLLEQKYLKGDPNMEIHLHLQPLADIHLNPGVISGPLGPVGNPVYSYVLSGIALFVLLIACVNFTVLSIARSTVRTREIGIRKVVGAARSQIMRQFWGEALLFSALALVLGIALAELFLPSFCRLVNKRLAFDFYTSWTTLVAMSGITVSAGLLAGSYPSLVLSGFQPVEVLKGRLRIGRSSPLTMVLVVFQFVLSIFLIVCTLGMSEQLDYLKTKDLGYNDKNLVGFSTRSREGARLLEVYRNALAGDRNVLCVTGCMEGLSRSPVKAEGVEFITFHYRVDYDYIDAFRIC